MSKNEKNESITQPETIPIQRKGTSDFLRIPAKWRQTIRGLQGHLEFDATVERDEDGILCLVFRKVKKDCHSNE